MATSAELYEKARELDALADDVEVVCDDVHQAANHPQRWQSPNADEVRGALSSYRASARGAASAIRQEARDVRSRADAKKAEEDSARTDPSVPTAR